MIVYLNGAFLPLSKARISPLDRGFLYGDALFETFAFVDGQARALGDHIKRLRRGLSVLGIPFPMKVAEWRGIVSELCRLNDLDKAVCRLTVTRGLALDRGYMADAGPPTVLVTAHPLPLPPAVPVDCVTIRIPHPGLGLKTTSALPHILGRRFARNYFEGIYAGAGGALLEGTFCAVVGWRGDTLIVPQDPGILPSVTVARLVKIWPGEVSKSDLLDFEGLFLANASLGVVPVGSLDGRTLPVRAADDLNDELWR